MQVSRFLTEQSRLLMENNDVWDMDETQPNVEDNIFNAVSMILIYLTSK
jgi:hypothetical protein